MKKRLVITLVLAIALMLALAISSYAATITLYSGADKTSESTTHNGALTLTGNTEANETVTVYFTDDGRAWKAGETVSFTEDTNLYTIECTKISTVSEYNNATGGGNYILMDNIDNTKSGRGPINGDNCTTRIFMNGKNFAIGNADGAMIQGNGQSVYLLGEGYISSTWGGPFYRGHCNNKNTDVVWLVGKDITIQSNKDGGAFFTIWNTVSVKSLTIHVYGTIAKPSSGTVGIWSFFNADNITTDYDIYFHEGASVDISGCVVRYAGSTASSAIGEIIVEGGSINLPYTEYFFYDKSASTYNGTITVKAGTFNIANATTLAAFKSGIVETKKAQDINATSFKVICKECAYEMTIADFVDFTTDFNIKNYCPNCQTVGATTVVPKIFEAKGYSISPNGTAINGGYNVNLVSLAKYEALMGDVSYGIVIANSESFGGKTFFDENNKVNTEKAIQVEIDSQYSVFDCELGYGVTSNDSLKLVVCAYVVGEHGVSFIQSETGNAVESGKIAGANFKFITLDMIVALQPAANKED